jgi:16S rRNA (uracil1498-N3)-methyltransferase
MSREHHHYRFFVHPENIIGDSFIDNDKDLVNQIKNVFRLKKGNTITVLDNSGYEYQVEIKELNKNSVVGVVLKKDFNKKIRKSRIEIYAPLLKGKNFDLVLEKCTEIGVDAFCPVIYQNSIVKNSNIKDRWKSIVRESSEQCGRTILPQIKDPEILNKVFDAVKKDINIVGGGSSDMNISELNIDGEKNINVFIGPEGGFTDKELKQMQENGFIFCSLSENTLRAETACIVVLGTLANMC